MPVVFDARRRLAEARAAVRQVVGNAFLVQPRVLRRVVKHDRKLPEYGFLVPHRKTYIVESAAIRGIVENDELGLRPADPLPQEVILLAEPKDSDLDGMTGEQLLTLCWRLLFHARIDAVLRAKRLAGELKSVDIRNRIHELGTPRFAEAEMVLRREHFLFEDSDRDDAYLEFVAVFLEYARFAPQRLPIYFPALRDVEAVQRIVGRDIDVDAILNSTRIAGVQANPAAEVDGPGAESTGNAPTAGPDHRLYDKLAQRAEASAGRGNDARAAVLWLRASQHSSPEDAAPARAAAFASAGCIAERLREALSLDDEQAGRWRETIDELLPQATAGFWNRDRRILYDLQRVCLDHERPVYRIALFTWLVTFGRRPLRRPLPDQREVLMSKHLRAAAGRASGSQLPPAAREQLIELLHDAAASAERSMRERLRPQIVQVLDAVSLNATNLPERVARRKLVEELLDAVADRGYLTIGHLRDAVSRNELKMPDLTTGRLLLGDELLRADRRLAKALQGVYRRGDFYMRWLQRFSSLGFGTRIGRFLTLYLILPAGGAYVLLEFLKHLLHKILGFEPHIVTEWSVAAWGAFLFALMHVPRFRAAAKEICVAAGRGIKRLVIDLPDRLIQFTAIRKFLKSKWFARLRRFVLIPGALTAGLWFAAWLTVYGPPAPPALIAIYLALALLMDTRMGRDLEEITADRIDYLWHNLRSHVFVAIFEAVMAFFRWSLESFERLLYAVDEWLRFRGGETQSTLIVKAVLGMVWALIAYVSRFCVTLLLEPQINPIKHFPVVTVSHKVILPMGLPGGPLSQGLEPVLGSTATANAVAGSVVWFIPGVFGFLVWELRSNWRLYSANRPQTLQPVIVGSHGETMPRMLRPGFHSGTLPRQYKKLRKAERIDHPDRRRRVQTRAHRNLHHAAEAIRRYVERQLLGVLIESGRFDGECLSVLHVHPAAGVIDIEVSLGDGHPLHIALTEQSHRLLANGSPPGALDEVRNEALACSLSGFYKYCAADLLAEQIAGCFPFAVRFEVEGDAIVVSPADRPDSQVEYDLADEDDAETDVVSPQPTAAIAGCEFPRIARHELVYSEVQIAWSDWVAQATSLKRE